MGVITIAYGGFLKRSPSQSCRHERRRSSAQEYDAKIDGYGNEIDRDNYLKVNEKFAIVIAIAIVIVIIIAILTTVSQDS